jgi:lysozyme
LVNYLALKNRIKRNEGYSNTAYKDSLGFFTIGYGHLIRPNENFFLRGVYANELMIKIFEKDFSKALSDYFKIYQGSNHSSHTKEMIIEMIFQLGVSGQKKFVKTNKHLVEKNFFMAALEMKNSLWYEQTPKRVNGLIKTLLKNTDAR